MQRLGRRAREELADKETRQKRANGRLRQLVRAHYDRVDEHHRRLLSQPGAIQPTCAKGCAHCCNFIIFCEAAEAQFIVDHYPDETARAIPHMRRQQERLAKVSTRQDRVDTVLKGDQAALQRVAAAWADLYEPCGYLDPVTKECSVYEARPHPCRTYFVVTEPARCGIPHGQAGVLDVGGTRVQGHGVLIGELAEARGGSLKMGNFVDLVVNAWDERK